MIMYSYFKKAAVFSLILLFSSFVFLGASAQAASPDAPEILAVMQDAPKNKPVIEGTTDSNSFVHIYIDGIYNGKTDTLTGETEKITFSYTPYLNLSAGDHRVWAVAENADGEKSGLSNVFEFIIEPEPEEPEEESAPVVSAPVVDKNVSGNEAENVNNANEENIENGLEENLNANGEEIGEENEANNAADENERKVSPGVVIFIIFLVGIIAWIIWVNRELVKEKINVKSSEDKMPLDKK